MASIKFTNVKYYIGGGKKPFRVRHNQNYTIFVRDLNKFEDFTNSDLFSFLYQKTEGRVVNSKSSKIIKSK